MAGRLRALTIGSLFAASFVTWTMTPPSASAGDGAGAVTTLTATLDGKPIPLADVGKYFCDDFSYPVIRCSSSELVAEARSSLFTLLTAVDYVTIWEYELYSGAWMNVSQNYGVLALIGWNDRISSFKGRNGETGEFHTDWFNGGSTWGFCCNQQLGTLGGYNNTFSSVERT